MTVDEILEELERLLRDVDSYHQMREGLRKIIEQSGDEHVGTASEPPFGSLELKSKRSFGEIGGIKHLSINPAGDGYQPVPAWHSGYLEEIDYSKLIFHTDEDNVW